MSRLRPFLPLLLLPVLASAAAPPRLVSGYYTVSWEQQSFTPCNRPVSFTDRGAWWVSNPGPMMPAYRDLVEGDWGTIFVTVRADLTEPGQFGHLGGYSRAMAVVELVDARAPSETRDDCARTAETE
ncbi:hypothetical protein [Longimicrobium sp.]|uniref:hypothetical protein n=1 Tax=Longimicrobium sp. TaxID=2029185 RepID=UPI002E3420B3|nr:hypothetical protein [Longimicrobium sp.]HEX6038230.1 hypothetical protein [Longimicrobium sp.]